LRSLRLCFLCAFAFILGALGNTKSLPGSGRLKVISTLIFQAALACRNWHLGASLPKSPGCRGFTGPVPPPLWMRFHPVLLLGASLPQRRGEGKFYIGATRTNAS